MINLIPPKAKRSILLEYWVRVASVWMILLSGALVAAATSLLPAYVLVTSQTAVHQASAQLASQKVADYENASRSLEEASRQARVVVDEMQQPLFSAYITLFEKIQGEQVSLSSVELTRSTDGIAPITITGIAEDRTALASFRDRLLAETAVESVDLPISNLARDKDITFTITVTLAKQESS